MYNQRSLTNCSRESKKKIKTTFAMCSRKPQKKKPRLARTPCYIKIADCQTTQQQHITTSDWSAEKWQTDSFPLKLRLFLWGSFAESDSLWRAGVV